MSRFVAHFSALLKSDGKLIAAGLALALAIFAFDLYVRPGVAAGVLYIGLILICLWAKHPSCIYLMATIGTVLTTLGYFLSPEGGLQWLVLTNRGLAIFTIWVVALFSARRLHEIMKRRAAEISQDRYVRAVEGTYDGLWDWNILTDETYYSPRWAEIVGHTQEELGSGPNRLYERLHPDDRDRVWNDMKAHLKQRTPFQNIEFQIRHKNGNYIWARSRGRAVWDEDGRAIRMAGSLTDITEQKRAEEEIIRQKAQADQYLNIAASMMVALDSRGCITLLNRAGGVLLECDEKKALGKNWFDNFISADQRDMVRAEYERMMNGESEPLDEFENNIITANGARKLIRWLNAVVRDDGGNIIGTLSSGEDITERKLGEEELRISEERYRSIIETTSEGFSRIDADMKIIEVNDALCAMLGYQRDEILGKRPFDLLAETENLGLKEQIKEFIRQGGESMNREFQIKRHDGSLMEARVSAKSYFDKDGNFAGRFTFITDITEQKERDAQLQQSQKMEAVGQLTGGIAHEFNNLLMIILGNIEVLESRLGKDDPLQLFASSALKGALRGAELTQSLLAFSRKQRLQSGEVDLNGLVLGMQNLFQRTLGETILIESDLDEELWCTSADAGQIEAALLNFVLNARDAMPDGGTITVRTSNRVMTADTAAHYDCVGPGDYVTLEVRDTGAGMTKEQIEHAFEPFYTTKEVGQGTGLGLSVTYGFAKQSGGCLEIESEAGKGTRVRLSLPRCSEKDVGAEKQERMPVEPITGTGTILVVEDDADVRALLVSQLTDLGYEIIEAEDGPAALALLDEHPDIELLFSDVILPGGMSGPQSAVQAHHKHPDLKILFTSGYPEKDIEDLDVGGKQVAILGKPYRKTELAEAIATAMNST